MAISKADLKEITDEPTAVGSIKAVLAALVKDQTISADVARLVGHALDHGNEGGVLEAALDARPAGAKK